MHASNSPVSTKRIEPNEQPEHIGAASGVGYLPSPITQGSIPADFDNTLSTWLLRSGASIHGLWSNCLAAWPCAACPVAWFKRLNNKRSRRLQDQCS